MPINPPLVPDNYREENRDILARKESFYTSSLTVNQAFWADADLDNRFECGDQSVFFDVYGYVPITRRKPFTFNRIRRIINMITGYQRRNRKSTIAVPVENASQKTADQYSKIFMWQSQEDGTLETISSAFHTACVSGLSLLQLYPDFRTDPVSGDLRVRLRHYNSFVIDPYFRKPDLSDCNGLMTRTFLTKREVVSLLPDKTDEILGLYGSEGGARDGKFNFMPESYDWSSKTLLTYDEYYYRDFRRQKLLIDTVTGEAMEWTKDDPERLEMFLATYPNVTEVEQTIPTVRLAIFVQNKCLYDGPQPLGTDSYPFVPVFAYFNPQIPYYNLRVQSVVRSLRDSQYLYNRRKNIELDILESQINSGWLYKADNLVNPNDVYQQVGQGKGIAVKREANIADSLQQIPAPNIPPSMIELSRGLAQEIQEISGISDELLGMADDTKAGILAMVRQGAGLTTLQGLFDQLDFAQKLLGKRMLEAIAVNWTPGKVKRIIGEEPSPHFYNKEFGKYDAFVEEGLNTTTQRQMQFAQLLHLREVGVPIPDDLLLKSSTLQGKDELIEAVMANQQSQQQAAQAQAQIEQEQLKAQTEMAYSRAAADKGLAVERASRVGENQALAVERRAEAEKDRELGFLNLVKAVKELQDMDINQLDKLIKLSQAMKEEPTQPQTGEVPASS